ncbi:1-phosphofructokinase family hexose kinase [Nakamurella endophytica]|uniref:1-phosphofructokinase n=1 Tax=Nakamurella endophytica TaxID=1748367 RepID=A0A917T547_9ACTN|nr:hexose kinase [Nakamurella endophytica]GGM10861.1 1-phosphofructokinase [Nakamurella endophytica]
MLIATPNICLDITVRVPRLVPGAVLRATGTETTAGGKGVNVARAARAHGVAGVLTGFLPREDGDRFATLLGREGTAFLPVPVDGVLRVVTIFLPDDGQVTVVNGRGPEIDAAHWSRFVDGVRAALAGQDVLVCSGSLPPGVPVEAYGELTRLGHEAGVPVVVDGAPPVLRAALPTGPDLVSPNLSEAEGMLFGRVDEDVNETGDDVPDRAVTAARELRRAGAVRAVVTAGGSGAALATADGVWWLPSPTVHLVSPIGAGDSFAAGAGIALARGDADVDVVRLGMATASASCETAVAGILDGARALELFEQIEAEPR